jgi:hypothetical protein
MRRAMRRVMKNRRQLAASARILNDVPPSDAPRQTRAARRLLRTITAFMIG